MVTPDMTRPTARLHVDVPDMPRDLMAVILRRHLDHEVPEDGDRVRIGDGITGQALAEGIWTGAAGDDGHLGSVLAADGAVFPVPDGSTVDVISAAPRARPAVLTRDELHVAAELVAELAAVYDGEPLGAVADDLARRIREALLSAADDPTSSSTGSEDGDLVFIMRAAFEGRPIIQVHHESDGDWQFLTDGPVTTQDVVMAHPDHVWAVDTTLDVLRSLPLGHVARRSGVGEPWVIGLDEYEYEYEDEPCDG